MPIEIPISSSSQQVNPAFLFEDGFELQNQSVIPSQDYSGSFTQGINNVEFYVYDAQKQVQYSNYDFQNYQITENTIQGSEPYGATPEDIASGVLPTTNIININPESDTYNAGYTNGKLYSVYNFINHQLSSSNDNRYYLAEISGDRTEIRIKSNFIPNANIESSYISFEQTTNTTEFFDEFYITFGENEYHIGINSQLILPTEEDDENTETSVLIKLYDALPNNYNVYDELYVVTKTAETQVYEINFDEDLSLPLMNLLISHLQNNEHRTSMKR